jgi:hypothetical protein
MAEFDKLCESSDEVREGTAVYAEVRSLEVLRTGFTPRLTPAEDPYYGGFRDIDALVRQYGQRLHQRKTQTYSYFKGYEYGCYQALLLERLFPGWQAPFSEKPRFLDEEIRQRIGLISEDERLAKKRFERDYRFRYVWARHEKAVEERDAAYGLISAREGRSYVISFKPIHQYLSVLAGEGKKSYEVGLMKIFPRGVGAIAVDDIEVRLGKVPTEINQLYYMRVVDTDWRARKRAFTIRYEKKEGEGVYTKATLTTPLFELKAPQIRIVEEAKRVKIWILSRVS